MIVGDYKKGVCPAGVGPCACTGACLLDNKPLSESYPDMPQSIAIQPMSPVNVMVGHKLALIRNTLGWSQSTLAEKVGLSRASIANIEGGRQKVDLDNLETFCIALGVTPHHFMKGIWFVDGRK